jgi:hypothetical protein
MPTRVAPLLGREHVRDDRERRRHHERRPDADHRPQPDEGRRVVHEHGGGRGRAEDDEPDEEDALPTVTVAERARGQQEPCEDERVRVDDPLQLALARAGAAREVGERDVEGRDGRHDHHQREAHHAEDGAAARGARL